MTPSTGSFPGTPPQTGTGTGSGDRGSSPAHPHTALLGASVPPPQHVARNYSDFMRNLAAKYNNPSPNEYVLLYRIICYKFWRLYNCYI